MPGVDMTEGFGRFLAIAGVVAGVALLAALLLLAVLYRRLRRLRVPPGADLGTTLRAVPLGLVVLLDLLDVGLDVFSAPLVWWGLGKLRLDPLKELATLQAAVPFTGPLPVLTTAWIVARLLGPAGDAERPVLEAEEVEPGRWRAGGGG